MKQGHDRAEILDARSWRFLGIDEEEESES